MTFKTFRFHLFFCRFPQVFMFQARQLRSALKLPLCTLRISKLQPARPPSSRFSHLPRVFGRAALFLLPAVILVSFFAFRFTHHNSANQAPDSFSANSQNPLDLSAAL